MNSRLPRYPDGTEPSWYQPGGVIGQGFSRLGSFAKRQLEMQGQQQLAESQRAVDQGQAVGDYLSTTRFQDPQTYKDWANTALKYAAESNIRQLQGKPSEASVTDIGLLAPPSFLRGNAVAEMAGNPLTYLGGGSLRSKQSQVLASESWVNTESNRPVVLRSSRRLLD